MSADKLVFDLSQEIEGSPNVFVKKDWLNILDNMNQNYNSNQSVIDTSQLSNSNKWLSYREAYLNVPMLLSLGTSTGVFTPQTGGISADYAIGLKNWFGSIIHSFTLDYNGTTICQQTPYINMWNAFKLMTSLSWGDVATQGATIGFYPDDPTSWTFQAGGATYSTEGQGVCNNTNGSGSGLAMPFTSPSDQFNRYGAGKGNIGFVRRQQYINFDLAGVVGSNAETYSSVLSENSAKTLWKSYISNKSAGIIQFSINATIYLKHIHSFFAMCPLLKGVFMKMTMNLNNTDAILTVRGSASGAGSSLATRLQVSTVSNAVGGVCPFMVASATQNQGGDAIQGVDNSAIADATYYANLSVGATALSSNITGLAGVSTGQLSRSVYLYVPAYTFNPIFESAYLSSPQKQIKYTDVYQYQVLNIPAGTGTFNNLITNGIANIKSVLVIPFYSASANATGVGATGSIPVYQSPFDPAGCGATSPLCLLTNFNVVISGQNAIYNTERYAFEHFNNQVYGKNAVNGGMTDGLTSGLIDRLGFDMEYCYYYIDVSRMLPVEEAVPKSVQIIGQNLSARALDLWVFVEYGVDVSIDTLTGARVM